MKTLFLILFSINLYASDISINKFLLEVEKNFPSIEVEKLKIQALEAKYRSSQGQFDSYLDLKGKKYTEGYYDSEIIETSIVKPLKYLNSSIELGHRKSDGIIPTYYSEYQTHENGENFLRFKMSLLRYRSIDPKRYKLFVSKNNLQMQKLNWSLKIMDIKNKANKLYWEWVVNSEKEKTFSQLVKLNEERFSAVQNRVKKKDLAQIYLVESEQYLLSFKAELAQIRAEGNILKNILSFYDPQFKMGLNPKYELPKIEIKTDNNDINMSNIIKNRPELKVYDLMLTNNKLDIENSKQALKPKLDFNVAYYGSKLDRDENLGDETLVGLSLEIPIERNLGKGEIARAKTDKKLLQIERQLAEREIRYIVNNLLENLRGQLDSINIIIKEVENTQKLQTAEWKKFRAGASDFFLLNTRDVNFAKAKIKLIEKFAKYKQIQFELSQWQNPIQF